MNLLSLPFIGQVSLPFLLTSLIIGLVILILVEKRKTPGKEEEEKRKKRALNTTLKNTIVKEEIEDEKVEKAKILITQKEKEEIKSTRVIEDELKDDKLASQEPAGASSSSSCSSGSEEEVLSRPVRVSHRPKKKCKGSVLLCATKRKVTAVTIVTDSTEEEVKVSLESFAGEIRSGGGVPCTVHPATTHLLLPALTTEPSHLLLVFGTSMEGCEGLEGSLRTALGGDAMLPPPHPFLYTVSCWSADASGEVYESARKLSASLGECGGAEWFPVTSITPTPTASEGGEGGEEGDTTTPPVVMSRHQYINTVMEKMTKPPKKCCGTSCGTKTVDIEDLAASLLLPRAAVTS